MMLFANTLMLNLFDNFNVISILKFLFIVG